MEPLFQPPHPLYIQLITDWTFTLVIILTGHHWKIFQAAVLMTPYCCLDLFNCLNLCCMKISIILRIHILPKNPSPAKVFHPSLHVSTSCDEYWCQMYAYRTDARGCSAVSLGASPHFLIKINVWKVGPYLVYIWIIGPGGLRAPCVAWPLLSP